MQTIVFWGTYDLGKPRTRLLLQGLREHNIQVIECGKDIWVGVEDKSQIRGLLRKFRRFLIWLSSYPRLIVRYLQLPRHDAVICAYPGALDVIILCCFAWLRGVPIIWDIFISVYDTVVLDRKIISHRSPLSFLLYLLEWIACRAASVILMDTATHAAAMERLFSLPAGTIEEVPVGCECNIFHPLEIHRRQSNTFRILFYGQFIPLHGIDVIIKSLKLLQESKEPVHCTIIGSGQEQPRIDKLIRDLDVRNLERIAWIAYERLPLFIHNADACLGIFRGRGKAMRVIPNKAYQILAMGSILVTGDTPAARKLLAKLPQVRLVPPDDPEALAKEIIKVRNAVISGILQVKHAPYAIDAHKIGEMLLKSLSKRIR